jgi:hypothetical protein
VDGLRGHRPWPLDALRDAVTAADRLWQRAGAWSSSIDINPLIVTDSGVVVVDVLVVADEASRVAADR